MRVTEQFVLFFSDQDVFSQWYPSSFTVKGKVFPTAEHYMMYCKACLHGDKKTAELILHSKTPREAKALGRKVSPFNPTLWEKKAASYVRQASLAKFRQNPKLRVQLLSYAGKRFVEASPYDKIWGVGLRETDNRILDPRNWKGRNLLGDVLTIVAGELAIEFSHEVPHGSQGADHEPS